MLHNYPYLKDTAFLKDFYENDYLKEQYVKIIILSFDEKPIQQIQGRILSGNVSLDGSSGMRRTCNLNMTTENEFDNSYQELLNINKKVEVLIGFLNTTSKYSQYPILWFPQGVYVIISLNINNNLNETNISLTLHDKMALLNGECGGVIPASTTFHQIQTIDENGESYITNPTIFQIIQELVHHFGGQQLGKIIINDIDTKIKQVMKWTGSFPIYLNKASSENDDITYTLSTTGGGRIYSYGEDIGFILTDFTYPGELIGNAGDTVVTILDQIKDTLGNYEYFYDINGNFVFQQIKNYLNKTYSSTFDVLPNLKLENYLADYTNGKSVYTFNNAKAVQSYSNTPQYQQIKNDFLVWGIRKTIQGIEIPIRYHLAFDSKPQVGFKHEVVFYTDPEDGILKAKKPIIRENAPSEWGTGEVGYLYYYDNVIYEWNPKLQKYDETSYKKDTITSNDYRTELYLAGIESDPHGLDSNYYYTELKNEWPKLYDLKNGQFFEQAKNQLDNIDFFLDILDISNSNISNMNVQSIGRRTAVIVDNTINCIFEPKVPDYVYIKIGESKITEQKRNECINRKQKFIQLEPDIYDMLICGGVLKSAYQEIRSQLYQYTNYNEQISLTTLPIYNLQPNSRITVQDVQSGIFGDYIIKTISLPLDINGMMSLTCTRALERI